MLAAGNRRPPRVALVLTDRANRRTDVFAAHKDAVASRDNTAHRFAGLGINPERVVVDALRDLDISYRLGHVSRLVNVGRHL